MTFKVGDKVRYIEKTSDRLTHNSVYTVRGRHHSGNGVLLEGHLAPYDWWHDYRFELVSEAPKPHKWAKEIKAWADGAEIECFSAKGGWVLVNEPSWITLCEYRIKPEKKPDVVIVGRAVAGDPTMTLRAERHQMQADNVQFTFDGETGKLKAVQILGN